MEVKTLPVISQIKLNLCMDLVITENLVRVNPTKTKAIKVPIYTPTSKDIKLKKKCYWNI